MGLTSDKETRTCPDLEARVGTCEQELAACTDKLESAGAGCNKSAAEERLRSDPDVFLRRYVNHLVYKLGLESGQESHLKLEVYLSPGQTQTLLSFAKFQSPTPAVDVDTILSSLIRNVESFETSPFVDNLKEQLASLKDPVLVLLMSIALVYLSLIVFRRLPPVKVFVLLLCVSLVWHSVLLYKDALAAQQVKLMKDVPAECRPGEMSFLQSVTSYVSQGFSNVDKCAEYHKALLVDPIYEINPLTALVDLITKIILHPLTKLGEAVGKMFSGLLNNVPIIYQIPIIVLFSFILLFILLLIFGYKIRLPFFLGEIAPAQAPTALPGHDVKALELRNKELRLEVNELKQLMGQFQPQSLAIAQEPRPRAAVSGVEELVPVAEKQDLETHGCQQTGFSWIQPTGTPSRRRNRELVLTPVKKMEDDKNDKPDKDEIDGGTDTAEALEKCPKSPSKNLFVKNTDNPKSTKFEWVEVQDSSQESSEGIILNKETGDIDSDFLERVEEIFDDIN